MRTLICGSIAYDTIMVFGDRFKNHILPDQLHNLFTQSSGPFGHPAFNYNFGPDNLAELRAEVDVKIERLSTTLERRLGEQTRWLFGAWAIVLASVIGLWFRR